VASPGLPAFLWIGTIRRRARNPRWEPGMGMIPDPRQIGDGDGDGDRGFRALIPAGRSSGLPSATPVQWSRPPDVYGVGTYPHDAVGIIAICR
jgi:hypothetical protein